MQNFWCKNPQVAAEAVRCRWPKSAEHTIFIADEICRGRYLFQDHWEMEPTHTAVDFGAEIAGIDWAAVPFGDPEWLYAMNRHTSLVNLAKAWLYTGDDRYARQFAALLDDWIARVPRPRLAQRTLGAVWKPVCAAKTGCAPPPCWRAAVC